MQPETGTSPGFPRTIVGSSDTTHVLPPGAYEPKAHSAGSTYRLTSLLLRDQILAMVAPTMASKATSWALGQLAQQVEDALVPSDILQILAPLNKATNLAIKAAVLDLRQRGGATVVRYARNHDPFFLTIEYTLVTKPTITPGGRMAMAKEAAAPRATIYNLPLPATR